MYLMLIVAGLVVAVALRIIIKVWAPSVLNIYDREGTHASIPNHCIFCKLIHSKTDKVYEDDQVYVFTDLYPKASIHLLIIPKRHIKNLYHLKSQDLDLLKYMKGIAESFKPKFSPAAQWRYGFHHPFCNSIQHLHLHAMALPYKSVIKGKLLYNKITFIEIDRAIKDLDRKHLN